MVRVMMIVANDDKNHSSATTTIVFYLNLLVQFHQHNQFATGSVYVAGATWRLPRWKPEGSYGSE